jgi:adenylate kinase
MLRLAILALVSLAAPVFAQTPGHGLVMVLIGPPGAGKTTQAQLLQRKYGIAIISADKLRQQAGLSEDKLNELLRQQVKHENAAKGFIIDGYPATRAEAEFLEKLVKEADLPPPIILHLQVPDDVARQRLAKRDGKKYNAAEVNSSLAAYHKDMDFIRSYYPEADIWTLIGTKPPRDVFNTIVALVQDRK